MIDRQTFSRDNKECIEQALSYIHDSLVRLGVDKKQCIRTELLCEETILQMISNSDEDSSFTVTIKKSLGETVVTLRMPGKEFDISTDSTIMGLDPDDSHTLEAIRSLVLMSYGDNIKYNHKKNYNHVRIVVSRATQTLYITLAAMLVGLLFGFAMEFLLPEAVGNGICDYALVPIKTMFMSALKMVIAPVVFFSIVTCFSQFGSIAEFGRLGAKIMGMYLFTTVCATALGAAAFYLIKPGEFGFALHTGVASYDLGTDTIDTSILSTLIGIVPSNILSPFLESNTLQLIFIATISGIALGMIGDYAVTLKELFDALNSLFLTITKIVARAIPIAVFCSMAILARDLNASIFGSMMSMLLTHIGTILSMLVVYAAIILVFGGLSPMRFYKKAKEGMLTAFTLCSSSASMPTNLNICTDKLGISPKVCNFSIPLGATVNMDGTCVYLMIFGLSLARAYGIEVPPSSLLSLAITIALLSLGAPGIPGVGIVLIGIVLNTLNVPVDAISLMIGISPILDMFDTMSNVTGDMAISLVVAKREKLVDIEKYNS